MTTVAFTGDVAFSQYFKDAWQSVVVDEEIQSFLNSAQYVVANVEGPVTDRPFVSDQGLNHASPVESAGSLRDMHMNVWNLSNNHVLDCGIGGVADTLRAAEACGCVPLGVGRAQDDLPEPLVVDGGDCRVGIISILDAWSSFTDRQWLATADRRDLIREHIRALKKRADFVVVVAHAGREYTSMPLPPERARYLQYLAWGADVVVAHHPHVVQHYEQIGRKLVFYSLGNFIFDTPTQRQFRYTDRSVLLRLAFSASGEIAWTYMATRLDRSAGLVRAAGRPGEGAPAIFQALNRWEYGLLWPLAARVYRENCEKKRALSSAGSARGSRLFRFLGKVKLLRTVEGWIMLYGRVMALLHVYSLCRRRDILQYLAGGKPDRFAGKEL